MAHKSARGSRLHGQSAESDSASTSSPPAAMAAALIVASAMRAAASDAVSGGGRSEPAKTPTKPAWGRAGGGAVVRSPPEEGPRPPSSRIRNFERRGTMRMASGEIPPPSPPPLPPQTKAPVPLLNYNA